MGLKVSLGLGKVQCSIRTSSKHNLGSSKFKSIQQSSKNRCETQKAEHRLAESLLGASRVQLTKVMTFVTFM